MSRKQFLRGQFRGELPLRPPWALAEADFIDTCTRCNDCISACPQQIIKPGSGGFPEVDFSAAGCDYCEECTQACSQGALTLSSQNPPSLQNIPWQQRIELKPGCLAEQGIVCCSCGEVCEHEVIRFKPQLGGRSQIQIDTTTCDGCGECVSVCPVQSLQIKRKH